MKNETKQTNIDINKAKSVFDLSNKDFISYLNDADRNELIAICCVGKANTEALKSIIKEK